MLIKNLAYMSKSFSKTVKEHYMNTEEHLLGDKVPRFSKANKFISLDTVKSTLQNPRAKNNPVQPTDLLDIDLEGDFGKTFEYLKFV